MSARQSKSIRPATAADVVAQGREYELAMRRHDKAQGLAHQISRLH